MIIAGPIRLQNIARNVIIAIKLIKVLRRLCTIVAYLVESAIDALGVNLRVNNDEAARLRYTHLNAKQHE